METFTITITLREATSAQVLELIDGIEDVAYDGCDIDPETFDISWEVAR
jgi:hypothetical protein